MSNTSSINSINQVKLSVRLISADSYQSIPIASLDPSFSEFRGCEVKQIPVIRIFGTTSNGEKICLHVHGVFPYIYIPCTHNLIDTFVYHLATSIDSALNISLGSANSTTQHVYKIQCVTGIPFYGYHKKKHKFFKIYFYNPAMVKKASEILQNGSVMGQVFQPHEAHIPFILQFMMDYNIYGMSFVDLKDLYYRTANKSLSNDMFSDDTSSLDDKKYLPNTVSRQSTCELEADAIAENIINRQAIENGIDTNPGIAAIWEEEKLRRTLAGLPTEETEMFCPLTLDRQIELPPTDNDIYQQERFMRRLANVTMNIESDTSSVASSESYPLAVDENDDIINASNVEDHLSGSRLDITNEEQVYSQDSDETLINALALLASDTQSETIVDEDSILGSQQNVLDEEECPIEEEDEEDNPDLNLTTWEIDSASPWNVSNNNDNNNDNVNDKPQSQKSTNSADTIPTEMFEEDFSFSDSSESHKKSNFNIPAFDGPCDSTSSESDGETDCTIKAVEMRVCAYNPAENINTTPKRKRPENIVTVDSESKRRKLLQNIHKTPTRSPRRRSFLHSPSSSRKYSPLNVQIITSPKVTETKEKSNKVLSEQQKVELEILRSIKKTGNIAASLEMHDDEILAEDSDDSASKGTCTSPIVTRTMHSNANKSVARKLKFHKDSLSQERSHLNNQDVLEIISESSVDSNSDVEDIKLQISSSNKSESFSRLLSISRTDNKYSTLRPKFNPPSRDRIISTMDLYDIPKCRYQEPFYNDEEDIEGGKEVAHKILKVLSNGLSSLQSFVSTLEDIHGIDYWRNSKMQIFESSQNAFKVDKIFSNKKNFASHSLLKIIPLIPPPNRKRVENWLKAKEYLRRKKEKERKAKSNSSILKLDKVPFRIDDDDDDDDKTICESTCSNEDTLIEDTQVLPSGIPFNLDSSQEVQSSSETDSVINPSIQNILDDSKLLDTITSSKHCGVSCGQIEFSSDSTRENVDAENLHNKALAKNQFITIMCLEVHINTREDFVPDPQKDAINAVFYAIQNDVPPTSPIKQLDYGVIVLIKEKSEHLPTNYANVTYVKTEERLLEEIIQLVIQYDPEILIGWELENLSWGYVFQRAAILGFNFSTRISRIPKVKYNWEAKSLDLEALVEFKLPGRIVLEIWRTMRHEIALYSYTFENIMFHVLNERLPYYSWQTLTQFWSTSNQRSRCKVIDYYTKRVIGILRILEQLDIIGRTSEFARLYGVQFYEVFSRGSQFRVESMMLRLAKPFNYIPVSPSNQQRASMRAPEALPLIMEPESCFYSDPLVVLDFQSLYPSIIIAYNYCFSTCVGRIEHIGQSGPFVFGATTLKINKKLAIELDGKLNFSPCGVGFVKPEVRKGVLPQMLTEILNTRLMVKKAMKDHSSADKTLQKALHSRQLGLKLIANVTYGYTAANFSGRMPCIEVGDSVVSKGKETLERAIRIVESTPKWGARVVYGDTDSLFILLKGKTRKEAFEIGRDMADAVTQANPPPVKLKFEKVLQPSILQTKKRYCGYMYENENDEKPVYLAKGIETVRRDGCPAVSKILAKSLKILFETKDVSQIKQYVTRQFDKILQGKVSIEDLTFAREFRGLRGYRPTACVPALELTRRLMKHDPRAVPRNHERVRYVIVAGAPNEALIRCVRSPMEVIQDPGLRPNAIYYITRVIIPPLNRCLNLIGVDAHLWFNKMPHRQGQRCLEKVVGQGTDKQKITISQYFDNAMCTVCGKQTTNKEICDECKLKPGETIIVLTEKVRQMERVNQLINRICYSCTRETSEIKCESLDCPVFYRRSLSATDYIRSSNVYRLINSNCNLDF